MIHRRPVFGTLLAAFALAASAFAQTDRIAASDAEITAQWRDLLARRLPESARLESNVGPKSPEQLSAERTVSRSHFVAIAQEARAFREDHPSHPNAGEARALEASSLIKAALLGDEGARARYPALVDAVRTDTRLLSPQRFEVVALAELQMLATLPANATDRFVAREDSARYLITEFPGEVGGYASLLAVADATEDPKHVSAVVGDVLRSPAPFAARAQAQVLGERYELIGKSLADLTNTVLGRDSIFEKARGKQAVVYSWATWSRRSVEYARELAQVLPKDVLVFGVNLDRDVAAAQAAAERESLPGEQLYHEAGIGSLLALRLKLNAAPMMYVTDANGVIRDVTAHRGEASERVKAATSTPTR